MKKITLALAFFIAGAEITSAGVGRKEPLEISGVYPSLCTYAEYTSPEGKFTGESGSECGIGAVVPWAGRLWMINYAPHKVRGSGHKLYSVDEEMNLVIRPESIGGTPAGRMIHRESNQLLIGPYLIDAQGKVRVILSSRMPGRLTAIARHLKDPANMVYYFDMEGKLYEVNVHTLEVTKLFEKPVPGLHGKGGYTSQGRLVIANNGAGSVSTKNLQVRDVPKHPENAGILAQWDGEQWSIVERRQFTDVTGPGGIYGAANKKSPLWAIGWDKRSLRLKLLDWGKWHTFLLPKAQHCNDPRHGWFTEWPRIREIGGGRMLMDMHGMFFNYPVTFSAANTAGISPIGSHLRYIPDFCNWDGRLVLATDETSIQGNPMAGQPQSNLWFGKYEDLLEWGPASGWGGPWMNDEVKADTPSEPFLINGFDRRILHLAVGGGDVDFAGVDLTENLNAEVVYPAQEKTAPHRKSQGDVIFTLEIDVKGNGKWREYEYIAVPDGGYGFYILPSNLRANWIRLKTDKDCIATAYFHLTDKDYHDLSAGRELFAVLADVSSSDGVSSALLYSAKRNRDLRVISTGDAGDEQYFDFTKESFEFKKDSPDEGLKKLIKTRAGFSVDEASVIIETSAGRLRLPKGNAVFDEPFAAGRPRAVREVESERDLANIHGTFYEVPKLTIREPLLFGKLRPVASHNKRIFDYCSWNGLLVVSGVRKGAENDGHVFSSADGQTALWFGGIDDIWKLGKPVGHGGPWKDTEVTANAASDPYLMTGFDKKKVELLADREVTIVLEINFDHNGWHQYESFKVPAGKKIEHKFPTGYSAHWIRARADKDCKATVWFVYE